jgi:RNAse (barnase) inhibitor barstar
MATFTENESNSLDYTILRDGGVSLYRRKDFLQQDGGKLSEAGYKLFHFACERWTSEDEMHQNLLKELSFPSYYGNNLNALDEVMAEIDVPATGGVALVLFHYDKFAQGIGAAYGLSETVLHILSKTSHEFLLTGRRFLTLVQSDDPNLSFPQLGRRAPSWNSREWLNKDRGL